MEEEGCGSVVEDDDGGGDEVEEEELPLSDMHQPPLSLIQ